MAHYLVTGGAGFIGSHLSEEMARRGHHVRVADQPDHREPEQPGSHSRRRVHGRGPRRPGVCAAGRRRVRLRAASGRDSVRAAFGQGSHHVEPRQRGRDTQRARGGARRRREASRVRGLLLRLRQYADAAEARGDADQSALSLRAAESRRRAVPSDVHEALRSRDRVASATSMCSVRARIRRRRIPASSRCSPPRSSKTARRRSTATASRRATSPMLQTSWTECCARARRRGRAGR